MITALLLLCAAIASAFAWTCPACGLEDNADQFCVRCDLPVPPEGMVYVPACSVRIEGVDVFVPPFFIDAEPVTFRRVLDWLTGKISQMHQAYVFLTGQESLFMPGDQLGDDFRDVVFVRYTPWVIYRDLQDRVTGVTVQTGCFDMPANAMTFDAARLYLNDRGRRLPTLAQMTAAEMAGVVSHTDTWELMSSYGDFLSMTLSAIVGIPPADFAIFSGNGEAHDPVLWEWTRDAWAQPPDSISDLDSPYAVIVKPLDPPVTGTALREYGYFNVIFRGVVPMPWYGID